MTIYQICEVAFFDSFFQIINFIAFLKFNFVNIQTEDFNYNHETIHKNPCLTTTATTAPPDGESDSGSSKMTVKKMSLKALKLE